MEEKQSKWKQLSSNFLNIILIGFCLYLIFLIGNTIWQNYNINKKAEALDEQLLMTEIENYRLRDYLEYYKSPSYQDIEIRKRLLLKKPGEKVVYLPKRDHDKSSGPLINNIIMTSQTNEKIYLPNYIKWWRFILSGSAG